MSGKTTQTEASRPEPKKFARRSMKQLTSGTKTSHSEPDSASEDCLFAAAHSTGSRLTKTTLKPQEKRVS